MNTEKDRRIVVLDIETLSLEPQTPEGALDALTGRIVCIGLLIDNGNRIFEKAVALTDEIQLLRKFWNVLKPADLLVGHNILEFDLPFIRQRSWIHNLKPSRSIDIRKYYTRDVVDTLHLWTNWGYKKGAGLDNLARALGVGQKSGHGSDVAELWSKQELENIEKYCLEDVRLTHGVYRRLMYQSGGEEIPAIQSELGCQRPGAEPEKVD